MAWARRGRRVRRNVYVAPMVDDDSAIALAVALASSRSVGASATAPPYVCTSSPASSLALTGACPEAVAAARDQSRSWAQVAHLLGVTRASAWQRYSGTGPTPPAPEHG